MIANEVYAELKSLKRDRSFSTFLKDLLVTGNIKKGIGLRECFGIFKEDKEWEKTRRLLDRGWKRWSKRYA